VSPGDASEVLTPTTAPERVKAVPVRHPGRWVAAGVVLLLSISLVHSAATNPRFGWDIVGKYFFSHRIIHGWWRRSSSP
jgi:polar amino acid transport system permease protein